LLIVKEPFSLDDDLGLEWRSSRVGLLDAVESVAQISERVERSEV
jgi:hypothetical protein